MRMRSQGDISSLPPYNSFFRGQFPALRNLRLESYPPDLARPASTTANGLTRLVLDNRLRHQRHDLLEYLGHCKNLVYLGIDLPELQGAVPASHITTLPSLRELQSAPSSLKTLCHLLFPPSTDIRIGPRAGECVDRFPFMNVRTREGLPKILEWRAIEGIRMTFDTCLCGYIVRTPFNFHGASQGQHLSLQLLLL